MLEDRKKHAKQIEYVLKDKKQNQVVFGKVI